MKLSPGGFGGKFWCLVGAIFLGFTGIGTVLPRLAPHIRHDLGGSDQTVGFAIGIFSFVALISRFVSGPLADRRGRKTAFLAGLSSCALAGVFYFLPLGIPGVYCARLLQGFGEACLYTGAAAWAVEMAGVDRSAQVLGYLSSGIWGGISAGPLVGQWLGSFHRAAAMQVCAALVAMAVLAGIHEEYKPAAHPAKRRWIPRGAIAPGLTIGLVNVQYPVITGFLILHLAGHGGSGPVAFSVYACMILTSRFFLGGLPDRIHPAITFYSGLSLMFIGLLVIALGPPPAIAIGAAALLGLGFSFPWSSVASTVLRSTPSGERGAALGVLTASYDLFVGVSAFAAGAVAKTFGYPPVFVMAALAQAGAAIVGRFVFAARKSRVEIEVPQAVAAD